MNQIHIAEEIVQLLHASGQFDTVSLDGSLTLDSWDELSDIDIVVEGKKRSPFENVMIALDAIGNCKKIIFYDWARGLLPEKHLISIYLKGVSVFWYVDISCYRDSKFSDINKEELPQDYAEHLLKLWICNVKHEIRKDQERNKIDIVYHRLFQLPGDGVPAKEKFTKIWERIPKESLDNSMLSECDNILSRIA